MIRLQIEIEDARDAELERLMDECGIRTKKEFVNNALTLFEWAIRERKKGNIIAAADESGETLREVLLPALERVRPVVGQAA